MSFFGILLAVDNDELRRDLRHYFDEVDGYRVIGEIVDGRHAVSQVGKLKPDIFLMDINLPSMDGIKVVQEIVQKNPKTDVIIMIQGDQNPFVPLAIEYGAKACVYKDIETRELVDNVIRLTKDDVEINTQKPSKNLDLIQRLDNNASLVWKLFLDSLLKMDNEAIICVNEDNRILLFNRGAESIFGYKEVEIIDQPLNIILPYSYRDIYLKYIAESSAAIESSPYVYRHLKVWGLRKNGEVFPARTSIAREKSEDLEIMTFILRDISEQNQLEHDLKKLSVVVEQTPAIVVMTDINGKIEYVNPSFERVTGYNLDEVIGENPRILKSGKMPKELYQEMWGAIKSGKVWGGELCNRKKNGDLYWELGTVSPIKNLDGEITHFISVKEDITERKKIDEELNKYREHLEELVMERTKKLRLEINERKRTEEVLRENELRLAEAQRIAQLGSWEWDLLTDVLSWSDEIYRIFCLDRSTFELNFQNALDKVHPEDREMIEASLDKARADGNPLNIDHRIVLPDGQVRTINLNAVPFYDKRGNITKMVGTVQDISERIRINEELLEKERLTKELAIGQRIQLSMLPDRQPDIEGWQIAVYYQAARQVGGDFYDFIPLPDGRVGIVVADVSGKGIPAALFMALSRSIVRTIALDGYGPAVTLQRSNGVINKDYFANEFVTICYAIIDPDTGLVEYANAGHNRPLWYSSKHEKVEEFLSTGMAIGLFPEIDVNQEIVKLMPEDVLVLYTDGIVEASNVDGEYFEESRLKDIFRSNIEQDATEILNSVVSSWKEFTGNLPQFDDITLIVLKRDRQQ